MNELPLGGKVELTFEVPAGFEGSVYSTDDLLADGDAVWAELPFSMIENSYARITLQSTGTYVWFSR